MIKEFKEFAMRGSVVDMGVGIVIGAAFGNIVKSVVDDVIMPPIGLLLGNVDFSNLFLVLKAGKVPGPYAKSCRSQGSGRSHFKCGSLHQHHYQLSNRCFCHIHSHQTDQQAKETRASTRGGGEGMSLLPIGNSSEGEALSPLHFRNYVMRDSCRSEKLRRSIIHVMHVIGGVRSWERCGEATKLLYRKGGCACQVE